MPSVLPLVALVLVAFLLSSKKASAAGNGGGSSGGGGTGPGGDFPLPDPNLPPSPPHELEVEALFALRSGDLPAGLAKYYTDDAMRWKDLEGINGMQLGSPAKQAASGWHAGTKIRLPAAWRPFSQPLPTVGGFNPSPGPSDQFPEAAT